MSRGTVADAGVLPYLSEEHKFYVRYSAVVCDEIRVSYYEVESSRPPYPHLHCGRTRPAMLSTNSRCLSFHPHSLSIYTKPPSLLPPYSGQESDSGPPIRDNLSSRMAAFLSLRWIPVSALLAWLLFLWPSETVVRRAQARLGNTWLRLSQKTSAQMTRHS